jgi:hypothetical protein
MSSTGDVVVFGAVMGMHFIEDIGVNVPQGMVVTIEANQAMASKDLWKAISDKFIFRLHSGPLPTSMQIVPQPLHPVVQSSLLEDQNRILTQALEEQRSQNTALVAAVERQREAIEALVTSFKEAKPQQVVYQTQAVLGAPRAEQQVIVEEAPVFVPSTIKPENTETRIDSKTEASETSDVSSAASKLRALKAGR